MILQLVHDLVKNVESLPAWYFVISLMRAMFCVNACAFSICYMFIF